ncbi:hypothetical protein [Hyphomonas sp.]|uniref:hypothetical protein n=1 Tax=Hyphomonas sp. TaxID=87 RepID=UPI0039187F47
MQRRLNTQTPDTASAVPLAPLDALLLDTEGFRKARTYAKLVLGTRTCGDLLLEEAISQYLLNSHQAPADGGCFLALLQTMRMLLRLPGADYEPPRNDRSKALMTHYELPLDVREAAALHLSAELSSCEIAALFGRTEGEIDDMLNQTWGSYLMLLSFCAEPG